MDSCTGEIAKGDSRQSRHTPGVFSAGQRLAQGKKLAKARAAVTEALRVAETMAQSAHANGVPETQIAAELGVDRMTVRKWLGKR